MLPAEKVVLALAFYFVLLAWARLLSVSWRQLWRMRWALIVLFGLDWWLVGIDLAVLVALRLVLLAGSFTLFFNTTTADELRLAMEWMRVPHRFAFSLSLAFQALDLMDGEWHMIRDAQRARGAWSPVSGWRGILENVRDMVALTVPTVVLTAKRAWAMTETAYARGFDSPRRRAFQPLSISGLDWGLLGLVWGFLLALTLWKFPG
jgi:energy-coupling factor transporter transmembrane protein EcfT